MYANRCEGSTNRRNVSGGCLEGALLGVAGASLYSVITGEFSAEAAQTGAILGASIGAVIDLTQYLMRWNRYDHKRFSL